MPKKNDLLHIQAQVRKFCEDRDWDQFHGAKDLAIALINEASELLEHFRYKSDKEVAAYFKSGKNKTEVSYELADMLFLMVRFAQMYGIDLGEAFEKKLKVVGRRYPVRKARGSNRKYTEL